MSTDPRLHNTAFLTLAAFRLRERRQHQVPDWRHTVGISSLLEAARGLPKRDPWDLPALDTSRGLGKLLAEARLRQQEGAGGT